MGASQEKRRSAPVRTAPAATNMARSVAVLLRAAVIAARVGWPGFHRGMAVGRVVRGGSVTVLPHSGTPSSGPGQTTQSSGDWSKLGFEGDPLPGDPQALRGVVDDFTYLRDTAWTVYQGLDAFVASASSGGFEGATADALREVVSGRLKTFVYNVARSFSLAGVAVGGFPAGLGGGEARAGGCGRVLRAVGARRWR